jgi:hypothetical protein
MSAPRSHIRLPCPAEDQFCEWRVREVEWGEFYRAQGAVPVKACKELSGSGVKRRAEAEALLQSKRDLGKHPAAVAADDALLEHVCCGERERLVQERPLVGEPGEVVAGLEDAEDVRAGRPQLVARELIGRTQLGPWLPRRRITAP